VCAKRCAAEAKWRRGRDVRQTPTPSGHTARARHDGARRAGAEWRAPSNVGVPSNLARRGRCQSARCLALTRRGPRSGRPGSPRTSRCRPCYRCNLGLDYRVRNTASSSRRRSTAHRHTRTARPTPRGEGWSNAWPVSGHSPTPSVQRIMVRNRPERAEVVSSAFHQTQQVLAPFASSLPTPARLSRRLRPTCPSLDVDRAPPAQTVDGPRAPTLTCRPRERLLGAFFARTRIAPAATWSSDGRLRNGGESNVVHGVV
jgi:hypothetical protein